VEREVAYFVAEEAKMEAAGSSANLASLYEGQRHIAERLEL